MVTASYQQKKAGKFAREGRSIHPTRIRKKKMKIRR